MNTVSVMHEIMQALQAYGPGGVIAGFGVGWALLERRRAEKKDVAHQKELHDLRQDCLRERDKSQAELRRGQGDILKLIAEVAQAKTLQKETDTLHTNTLNEVLNSLAATKEGRL